MMHLQVYRWDFAFAKCRQGLFPGKCVNEDCGSKCIIYWENTAA